MTLLLADFSRRSTIRSPMTVTNNEIEYWRAAAAAMRTDQPMRLSIVRARSTMRTP
jgi:hypothetical protein